MTPSTSYVPKSRSPTLRWWRSGTGRTADLRTVREILASSRADARTAGSTWCRQQKDIVMVLKGWLSDLQNVMRTGPQL